MRTFPHARVNKPLTRELRRIDNTYATSLFLSPLPLQKTIFKRKLKQLYFNRHWICYKHKFCFGQNSLIRDCGVKGEKLQFTDQGYTRARVLIYVILCQVYRACAHARVLDF